MAYESPALDITLAAAVGDDPTLVAELREAFLESARRHADALLNAGSNADWRTAALRLQSIAASFGAMQLMVAASEAASAPVGDRDALRRVGTAMAFCVA